MTKLLIFLPIFLLFFFSGVLVFQMAFTQTSINPRNFYQSLTYRLWPSQNELQTQKFLKESFGQNGAYDPNVPKVAYFEGQKVAGLSRQLPIQGTQVLASTYPGEKWIEVSLPNQKLYAWEGDQKIYEFLISSGKPWAPTLTGEFRIWVKLRYTRMIGWSKARGDFYDLPNVPYTMYYDRGYGIHGAYWHNNFGQPMSHGCINLSIPDAEKLFFWTQPEVSANSNIAYPTDTNPGTRIIIHQ